MPWEAELSQHHWLKTSPNCICKNNASSRLPLKIPNYCLSVNNLAIRQHISGAPQCCHRREKEPRWRAIHFALLSFTFIPLCPRVARHFFHSPVPCLLVPCFRRERSVIVSYVRKIFFLITIHIHHTATSPQTSFNLSCCAYLPTPITSL